jgi:AraC-like DNA-binding protein
LQECAARSRDTARVRAAADADDYRSAPVGAYLAGRGTLAFCARADLWGFALWGSPEPGEIRALLGLLALELRPPARPHASLVDVRRIEAVDPAAFAEVTGYVEANFSALRRQVTRLAIIRPPGLTGATVAGFFQVARAPYPVEVMSDAEQAAIWAGGDAALVAELDQAVAAASGVGSELAELRRWLEASLADADLASAARALGRSPRSLQRRLQDAGTTFQRELDGARVRVAQRRLEGSAASLTEIALDVGCSSPQHFSALFRRVTGEAPSAWRSRRRPP